MAENSAIEWTDHTFNPWEGCQKVGPGCDHCYAETRNARFGGGTAPNWGPGAPRRRTSAENWKKPKQWNDAHDAFFAQHGHRQRVFCASLADVFDNEVPPSWRAELFALIAGTPNLDWLLLTKRIGNVAAMLEAPGMQKVLPANVRIGATIVNQPEYDRDIGKLLRLDCPNFLSLEPLLGVIDLRLGGASMPDYSEFRPLPRSVEWVIAGGESGPHARPAHPDWFRSLRDQCEAAGVPFLFKQHGEWLPINQQDEAFTSRLYRSNRKAALHEDKALLDDIYGRACTVPYGVVHHDGSFHEPMEPMAFLVGTGAMATFKVGKKAAGRRLDGVEHNGFPQRRTER